MIANKVYTRDEMREEHIITTDYHSRSPFKTIQIAGNRINI